MKILLVGNYLRSEQCSMQRFVEMLHEGLCQRGHQVTVLRPERHVGIGRSGTHGLGKWSGYVDRFLLFRPPLRRAARQADLVHVVDQGNAMYVPWVLDRPHVVTCHDLIAIRSALGLIPLKSTRLTGRLLQQWTLKGLRRAQAIVSISEKSLADMQALGIGEGALVRVVANANGFEHFPLDREEAGRMLREQGGIERDQPFVMHVGGDAWYKNREGVVKIFAQLVQRHSALPHKLILAGQRLPESLLHLIDTLGITQRVQALTDISDELLNALYCRADALLFPSWEEGFGWPIIEAQSRGCPVLTTDRSPMTEVGGEGALYVDPNDLPAAAETLLQLMQEKAIWERRGMENARRFTFDSMISGYELTYQAAIEQFYQK